MLLTNFQILKRLPLLLPLPVDAGEDLLDDGDGDGGVAAAEEVLLPLPPRERPGRAGDHPAALCSAFPAVACLPLRDKPGLPPARWPTVLLFAGRTGVLWTLDGGVASADDAAPNEVARGRSR